MTSHYSTFSVAMGNHLIPSSGSPDPQYHALGSCQHIPGHRLLAPSRTSSHPWVSLHFSFRMADGIFSSTKATHVHSIPSNHRKTPPEINIHHFRSIQRRQKMALLRCQFFSKFLFLLFALLGEFTLFFLALLGKQIRRFWEKVTRLCTVAFAGWLAANDWMTMSTMSYC